MSAGISQTGYNTALPDKTESLGTRTSLTNIETASDAWGKFIPFSWGASRVGGALVWASPFYKSVDTFRTTTQFQSTSTWRDAMGNVTGTDTETYDGRSTTEEVTSYMVDCAYSLGFEGDLRQNRLLKAVRINGAVVYDSVSEYVRPGIAFSIRSGRDLTIDPIMARIPTTGKYFYPGQTYIVFDHLPLAAFGNAMPTLVDVEFFLDDIGNQGFEAAYTPPEELFLTSSDYFVNEVRKRIYFLRKAENRFTVYDVESGQRYEDVMMSGAGWADFKANFKFDRGLGVWACAGYADLGLIGADSNNFLFAVFDLRHGTVQLGRWYDHALGQALGGYCMDDEDNSAVFIATPYSNLSMVFQAKVVRTGNSFTLTNGQRAIPQRCLWDANGFGSAFGYTQDGLKGALLTETAITLFDPDKTARPRAFRRIVGAIEYQGGGAFIVERGDNPDQFFTYDGYTAQGGFRYSSDIGYKPPPAPPQAVTVRQFIWRATRGLISLATAVGFDFEIFDVRTGRNRKYVYDVQQDYDLAIWVGSIRAFFTFKIGEYVGQMGIFGPNQSGLGIPLTSFLQTLYVATGKFDLSDIDWQNVSDIIRGALVVDSIDVEAVVRDICFVYRIEKRQTGQNILFYRERGLTGDLTISAEIDYSELAVIDEATGRAIETSRLSNAEVPAALTLRFIDLNNDYKTNEVTVRNPDTSIPNTQTKSVSLPIVMTVTEAYQLALNCINDMTTQAETHRFRLPPKYSFLESRDIIQINDRGHSEIIRITQDDFGGDFSVECQGQTVARQTRVEAPAIELPDRAVNGSGSKPAATRALVFDTPLLRGDMQPADDADGARFVTGIGLQRAGSGAWAGAYVARSEPDDTPGTLFNSYGPSELFVMKCTNALTDKRLVVDSDKLSGAVQGTWYAENNKTAQEIDESTDLNFAFYGQPGRWEIVRFSGVVNGEVVGIVRGLRGTEHNCGKHVPGDLFVIPQYGMGASIQGKAKAGVVETFRAVTDGALFQQSADSYSEPAQANSLRPFIPADIRVSRGQGGDVAVTWDRRDRLGRTGWGPDALPASDGALSYVVAVHGPSGAVLRAFPAQAGTALTYSAAQQSADGVQAADTLRISVQAFGKLPGFREVRSYNV